MTPKILWIAAEPADILNPELFSLTRIPCALDGLRCLRNEDFDVVLVSFPLPDWSSAPGLLEELQQAQPATPVVIHAPQATATEVVRLVRLGAFHVLQNGNANSLLYLAANSKWAETTPEAETEPAPGSWHRSLIGESRPMRQVNEDYPTGCSAAIHGLNYWGNRYRKGNRGAVHPCFERSLADAHGFGQLQRAAGNVAGSRAVRPCERRFYRRYKSASGTL